MKPEVSPVNTKEIPEYRYAITGKAKKLIVLLLTITLSLTLLSGCGFYTRLSSKSDNVPATIRAKLAAQTSDSSDSDAASSGGTDSSTSAKEDADLHPYEISLLFAGDINLGEGTPSKKKLDSCNGEISQCIDPVLIDKLRSADLALVNNEFAYSNRGEPLPNKLYTFRARPESVSVLQDLGIDVVQLANNHIYDYGKDALLDTFDTLDAAGIAYVGAGHTLKEAMAPYYTTIQGKTIAVVAASRAEKYKMTPQATETEPGILRCYDTELYIQEIKEARQNADYVIAIVHWGTEHSSVLETVQTETARQYIDAGADIIVGGHTHCLQGIDYYQGKPIIYSIGNFWFEDYEFDTVLLNLTLTGDDNSDNLQVSLIPAHQTEDSATHYLATPKEQRQVYDYIESISDEKITIDEKGMVGPAE